ncbi:alpha/beta hydrolase [Planococcus sp. APC 3900]|uniref:alpha/beta hydrolase n=1 Tax=Planococcus sp. APC 3900 TaxID=3035191 RepID=UPI0025B362A4|nr:alpha/beta hydrolase [Planococcus sp. APC 3900]MDN3438822.1 alpha/beta hydrolase [Planococcus sp. APC 3900]
MSQSILYNQGNNKPTIVAIPALGERKEIYESLAENLKEFQLLAIDLPGHNNEASKNFSIETYIEELKRLLAELSISEVHLIGNSIGAWIIQHFYKKFPEIVLSITLLDGGHYFIGDYSGGEDEEIELPAVEKLEDLQQAIQEQVEAMDMPSFMKEKFTVYLLGNFVNRDGIYVHHSDAVAVNALSKAVTKTNYCLKEESDVPLLLLLADKEKDESEAEKKVAFRLSQSEAIIKVIPKSHHLLPITNPAYVSVHFKELVMSLKQ